MMIIGVTQTANSFIALTRTGHWSLYHVWYPIKGASKIPQHTVRENILFGREYNRKKYQHVLYACGLLSDIEEMIAGDMTEIGEKGVNLSGGQKQRVSLARACYSDADVYICDDVLSAVDPHIANHIFNKCFMKLLKDKTIILATHAIQFLKYADNIIVMKDSTIQMQGKLKKLEESNIDIDQLQFKKEKPKELETYTNHRIYSRRRSSTNISASITSVDYDYILEEEAFKLTNDEERGIKNIPLKLYISFLKSCGISKFFFALLGTIVSAFLQHSIRIWLAH
eukprot:462291_1